MSYDGNFNTLKLPSYDMYQDPDTVTEIHKAAQLGYIAHKLSQYGIDCVTYAYSVLCMYCISLSYDCIILYQRP